MKIFNKDQNDIYNRNVEILKKRFPHVIQELDQRQARDPFWAYIREENDHRRPAIHIKLPDNRTAPLCDKAQFEALLQRMFNAKPPEPFDLVFILGMGLGEAGLTAVRRYRKKPRVVIIEPYPSLFKLALFARDLSLLLNYDRLELYIGDQAKPKLIINDSKKVLPVGQNFLFIHPYRQQLTGTKYKQLEQTLIHQIRSFRNIWHTTRLFGRQMMTNAFANLPSLLTGTPLRVLKNRLKGIPIICVAAGPSLDQALPLLKDVKNALILACDSAVGSLLQAGIRPHIVATADFNKSNFDKLEAYLDDLHDTVLAFGLESNPDIINGYPGSRRVGLTAYNRLVLDWLDQPLQLDCRVPAMTSVTHLAALFSIAMGGNPIILVGVDMAYLEGKSHAHGSVSSHIPKKENLIPVESVDGGVVHAPPQLVTDRLIMEQIINQHNVRIINVSMAGALVAGAEVKPLANVITDELSTDIDVRQILDALPWDRVPDHAMVQDQLQKTVLRFKELKDDCHRHHNRIANALHLYDPGAGQKGLASATKQIKKRYMAFKRKHRIILESIRDLMLGDKQTLIKKEEIAATTQTVNKYQTMAVELELINDHYGAITNSVDMLIDGLGKNTD